MTPNIHDQLADLGAADDEQSLGAALGRAMSDRINATAPPMPPPLVEIADRAAARARVRTAQHALVAVAASVLVVVGGVVGWNALNRAGTTTVFVTSDRVPDQSTGTVPATGEPAPDTGSRLASAGTGQDDSHASETPTPEDLSTGPVLQWTEIDPGFADLFGFESAGDGRVVAYAWPEGVERVVYGDRAVVTENGTDWEELPLPDGLIPQTIDISGDRWLVTGRYRNFDAPEGRLNRVFFSDDEGITWTELEFEVPPDPALASPYLEENLWVRPGLVSGERMVLVLQGYTTVDAESLLADRGLLPDGKEVLRWRDGAPGTVVFDLHDPFETDPDSPDFAGQRLELTLEQLGLTTDEWTELNDSPADIVRIFYSDGSSVEFVARYAGWVPAGAATADGFALRLLDDPKETILTSPDGLVWTEEQSYEYGYSERTITADGTVWRAVPEPLGSLSFQRAAYVETPTTVAAFQGLHPTGTLAAGPAGVAATAFPSLNGQLEVGAIGGLPTWRDIDRTDPLPDVPLWVGWSADGADWGWQSLPDTFGVTEGEAWAQLAVGRDFVIARVETFVVPTPEEVAEDRYGDAPPLRWFIARVP